MAGRVARFCVCILMAVNLASGVQDSKVAQPTKQEAIHSQATTILQEYIASNPFVALESTKDFMQGYGYTNFATRLESRALKSHLQAKIAYFQLSPIRIGTILFSPKEERTTALKQFAKDFLPIYQANCPIDSKVEVDSGLESNNRQEIYFLHRV